MVGVGGLGFDAGGPARLPASASASATPAFFMHRHCLEEVGSDSAGLTHPDACTSACLSPALPCSSLPHPACRASACVSCCGSWMPRCSTCRLAACCRVWVRGSGWQEQAVPAASVALLPWGSPLPPAVAAAAPCYSHAASPLRPLLQSRRQAAAAAAVPCYKHRAAAAVAAAVAPSPSLLAYSLTPHSWKPAPVTPSTWRCRQQPLMGQLGHYRQPLLLPLLAAGSSSSCTRTRATCSPCAPTSCPRHTAWPGPWACTSS